MNGLRLAVTLRSSCLRPPQERPGMIGVDPLARLQPGLQMLPCLNAKRGLAVSAARSVVGQPWVESPVLEYVSQSRNTLVHEEQRKAEH